MNTNHERSQISNSSAEIHAGKKSAWESFSTAFRVMLLNVTEPYSGLRVLKQEMLRQGVKDPKELPRAVRTELARKVFADIKMRTGKPYELSHTNMVGMGEILKNYGGDVVADLFRENLITFSAINQQYFMQNLERAAQNQGWKQE